MTTTDLDHGPAAEDLTGLTPAELQAAARRTWLADPALTGAELGARYGRGERWGRDRIAEARTTGSNGHPTTAHDAAPAPPGTANGSSGNAASAARPPDGTNGSGAAAAPRANGTNGNAVPPPVTRPGTATAAALPADGTDGNHDDDNGTGTSAPLPLVIVTVVAVAVVALVTTFASYSHTVDLARQAGQTDFVAAILPAAVDGLVVAGSTSLLVDHHLSRKGSPLAWAAVALGLVSSMAANVVSVDPDLVDLRHVKWVMAAYAPLALAVSGHLLLRMLGHAADPI